MTRRFKVGLVAASAALALLVGPVGSGTAWAGKKSSIKASINDAKFKVNRKPGATAAGGTYDAVTGILNIVGGSAKLSGHGLNTSVELKVLTLTLQVGDLSTATFPLTVPVDLTTFSRVVSHGADPGTPEIWDGENALTLTVTSYKNGRIKATFEGVIPADTGTSTDATVDNGKLSVLLNASAI